MPGNLWELLKRYKSPQSHKISGVKITHDALRHLFATCHLSRCRAVDKTAILMRHSSAQQLWSAYLDELTSEDEGREYFSIAPSAE